MTRPGDHWHMRRRRSVDDRSADALLSGRPVPGEPELSALVAAMRAQAVAAPPSDALAALLAGGFVPDPSAAAVLPLRPSTGVRRWALQVSLTAAALVALSLGAASNDLPAPVQTTVADVVEAITPLTVPRPAERPAPAVTPSQRPTTAPPRAVQPSDDSRPDVAATRAPSARTDDGGHGRDGGDSGRRVQPTTAPQVDDHGGRSATPRPSSTTSRVPTAQPTRSQEPDGHQSSGSDDRSGSGSDSTSGSSTSGGGLDDSGSHGG